MQTNGLILTWAPEIGPGENEGAGVATSGHKQLHSSDYSSLHFRGTWESIIVLQNIENTFLLGLQRVGETFCGITTNTKREEGDFNYLLKELGD